MSNVQQRATIALMVVATSLACTEQQRSPLAPPTLSVSAKVLDHEEKVITPAMVGWHTQARDLVGANNLSPLAAGRVYAALAVAQYDAVNQADDGKHSDAVSTSDGFGEGGRSRAELERGSIAGVSSLVLVHFFPSAAAAIDEHVRSDAAWFGSNTHPQFDRGLDVGKQAATRMITRVNADHFTDPWTGTVPVGPGLWRNNGPPAGPLLGQMTPYFLTSGKQFRPAPPPVFGSAEYATYLGEIRTLSDTRTAAQLASAIFWNFPTGTPTPLGYWNEVAAGLVESHHLDERAAAHVFALMHGAMMDALIGCFDAKYFYWFIRPSQADPAITLPIGLPNHPSYPSAHSCISSAASSVLGQFFPAEAGQLREQMTQAGLSRMYGGIHYRSDIRAGEALGTSVAAWAIGVDRRVGLLSVIH
jgi:hypothetical protein